MSSEPTYYSMKHFRYPGQEQESKWLEATYRAQKADSSTFPRPLMYLSALIRFYLIRRRSNYERHIEIANAYISYLKACLLRYFYVTSSYKRRKAKERKSMKRDMLRAKLEVQVCRKCGSKKVLKDMKTVITDGRVEFECKKCPSSSSKSREEQEKRRRKQRTDHRHEGVDLNYYRKLLGLQDERLTKKNITDAYREKAKDLHPDCGGDRQAFLNIKEARDELLKHA